MKAFIDTDNCICCGLCTGICEEVFRIAGKNYAEVYVDKVPFEAEATAFEAQKICPGSAITLERF